MNEDNRKTCWIKLLAKLPTWDPSWDDGTMRMWTSAIRLLISKFPSSSASECRSYLAKFGIVVDESMIEEPMELSNAEVRCALSDAVAELTAYKMILEDPDKLWPIYLRLQNERGMGIAVSTYPISGTVVGS